MDLFSPSLNLEFLTGKETTTSPLILTEAHEVKPSPASGPLGETIRQSARILDSEEVTPSTKFEFRSSY